MQRTISLTLLGVESLLQTAKNIFLAAFFCVFVCSEGFERERPKNSGHPLFLATDRSILQSTKFEFIYPLLCKMQEFESRCLIFLSYNIRCAIL